MLQISSPKVPIVVKNVKSHLMKVKLHQKHAPLKDQDEFSFSPYEVQSADAYLIKMARNSNLAPNYSKAKGKKSAQMAMYLSWLLYV